MLNWKFHRHIIMILAAVHCNELVNDQWSYCLTANSSFQHSYQGNYWMQPHSHIPALALPKRKGILQGIPSTSFFLHLLPPFLNQAPVQLRFGSWTLQKVSQFPNDREFTATWQYYPVYDGNETMYNCAKLRLKVIGQELHLWHLALCPFDALGVCRFGHGISLFC